MLLCSRWAACLWTCEATPRSQAGSGTVHGRLSLLDLRSRSRHGRRPPCSWTAKSRAGDRLVRLPQSSSRPVCSSHPLLRRLAASSGCRRRGQTTSPASGAHLQQAAPVPPQVTQRARGAGAAASVQPQCNLWQTSSSSSGGRGRPSSKVAVQRPHRCGTARAGCASVCLRSRRPSPPKHQLQLPSTPHRWWSPRLCCPPTGQAAALAAPAPLPSLRHCACRSRRRSHGLVRLPSTGRTRAPRAAARR
jgi:hypothetical protein